MRLVLRATVFAVILGTASFLGWSLTAEGVVAQQRPRDYFCVCNEEGNVVFGGCMELLTDTCGSPQCSGTCGGGKLLGGG